MPSLLDGIKEHLFEILAGLTPVENRQKSQGVSVIQLIVGGAVNAIDQNDSKDIIGELQLLREHTFTQSRPRVRWQPGARFPWSNNIRVMRSFVPLGVGARDWFSQESKNPAPLQ